MSLNPVAPSTSRTSAWEWSRVVLLAGNLAWTTLCLGGFRPETMVVTSALTGTLLTVHLLERAFARKAVPRLHPAGWLLLPFLAYAAANVIWVTPVPWLGWRDWLGWAQMIAVFWVVLNGVRSCAARAALFGTLIAIAVVAVGLGVFQRFARPDWLMLGRTQARQFIGRASGPFGIPNSFAALLLLLLPVTIGLVLRREAGATSRFFWGYLSLVFALGLGLTVSRGAWLSLAMVLIFWPVFAVRRSKQRRIVIMGTVTAGLLVAGAILYASVRLVHQRFDSLWANAGELSRPILWRGAWRIVSSDRLFGGGAASFDVLFDRYRPAKFQDDPLWAHNDYLNTLSDYGVTGFLLFFGACAAIGCCCRRGKKSASKRDWLDDRLVAGGMIAGLAAFALQLFFDFHFKIPALAMTFATMAALAVQHAWRVEESTRCRPRERIVSGLLAWTTLGITACRVVPLYRGEALRYSARQSINGLAVHNLAVSQWPPTLQKARGKLERAVAIDPANAGAWADLAYVIGLQTNIEPKQMGELGRESEKAADRALAASDAVPEFWVRKGVALDLQQRWREAGPCYVKALGLAPARAEFWYYEGYHLSLKESQIDLARAALSFCLRLDPGRQEAHKLLSRLAMTPKP